MIQDGNLVILWSVDDILTVAGEDMDLTEEDAYEVLEMLDRWHDAEIGINWTVIENALDEYVKNR